MTIPFTTRTAAVLGTALASAAASHAVAEDNWVAVHDPAIVRQGDTYYLFGTGRGIPFRTSTDLVHWSKPQKVFQAMPAWAAAGYPNARDCWAPDISVVDGQARLYYAVSTFGSPVSAIGLATSDTLDPADPKYKWVDQGVVVETKKGDDWNAIDPAAFVDAQGRHWLAAGSFWSGLKLFKLDAVTGKIVAGDQPRAIAARPGSTAIEGAFVTRHGDFYYLWMSFDQCCRGADSTYNTRVGRSRSPEGPYLDRDGKRLLDGGGTLVLKGYDNVRGPGHCAVFRDGDTDYLVHHWYDAANKGRRSLAVRPIVWDAAGWPLPGEPMTAPAAPKHDTPAGAWRVSTDFAAATPITLNADGTAEGDDSERDTWSLDEHTLTLRTAKAVVSATLSPDANAFVGRDAAGLIVRGRRDPP